MKTKFPIFLMIFGIFVKFPTFLLTGKTKTHFPDFSQFPEKKTRILLYDLDHMTKSYHSITFLDTR